jgi:hypothetical protein
VLVPTRPAPPVVTVRERRLAARSSPLVLGDSNAATAHSPSTASPRRVALAPRNITPCADMVSIWPWRRLTSERHRIRLFSESASSAVAGRPQASLS